MHLIRKSDANARQFDLELRRYYVPSRDPLEVIETHLDPGARQTAHAHQTVREAMLVLEGKVFAAEIVSGKTFGADLNAGDFAVFDRKTLHLMENRTKEPARTLHFKFLGDTKDRSLFLNDKVDIVAPDSEMNPPLPDEAKFKSYVDTYNNLDKILWQVPALLLAITAVAFGLFKDVFLDPSKAIAPFTHAQTIGVFSIALGFMFVVGVYSIWRVRKHHTMIGMEIARLEPGSGYFHKREKIALRWWWAPSAPLAIGALFAIFAVFLLAFSGKQFGLW